MPASLPPGDALRGLAIQQAATRALSEAETVTASLEGILESVCLALGWSGGEAWIVDPLAGVLKREAQWRTMDRASEEFDRVSQDLVFALGEGLPGRVWQDRRPLFFHDVTTDERFPRRHAAETVGIRSALGFPIDVEGETVAVMAFYTDQSLEADTTLMSVLSSVGQQIGNVLRRQQAEHAVRESETRKRAILEASLDSIISIDSEGRITEWNSSAELTLGWKASEAKGALLADLIVPPRYREAHLAGLRRIVETGRGRLLNRRIELPALRRDGVEIPVELTIVQLEIEGRPSFTATLRDLTEQVAAQARLRDEIRINDTLQRLSLSFATERDRDRLLQLIVDTGTVLTDASYGAYVFDAVTEDGAGYTLYTLSGADREAFRAFPMPHGTPLFGPSARGGPVRLADVREDPRFRAPEPQDGRPMIASYLTVPVKTASGEVLGGLFFGHPEVDRFTEAHERIVLGIAAHAGVALDNLRLYDRLKQSEESARGAYRLAAEAAQRKDEFLAMLSHELRNPLAPIMTAVELLDAEDRETLASARLVLERQAKHLLRLVDDLLDISRVTRGQITIDRRPVDLRRVIEAAVEMASPLLEKNEHRLYSDLQPDLWVRGDPARLAQIVSNLLNNAARYTDPRGKVWLTAWREGTQAFVSVRDDGIGIEQELLDRIFEPFAQSKQGIDRSRGGLGLGLALVRSLAEAHGGEVVGRSGGRGRGSEFIVRLPALDRAEAPEAVAPPSGEVGIPETAARRILVVDDNPDAAEILARGLRRRGHQVHVEHDGPSALASLEGFEPEVAILDIGLPVMDGYELARRLRARRNLERLRLVAVTGYGQVADRLLSRAAGFDEHLVKPVAMNDLLGALEGPGAG